ncbi:DUF1461 domain-containing protein [Candidatus Woesearchaeota archaeon]|nr:DUF1461 domain-containing protein [Candidatus Woesearchaeota archaeon]
MKGAVIGSLTISLLLLSFFLSAYDTGFYAKFVEKRLPNLQERQERAILHKEIMSSLKGTDADLPASFDSEEQAHMEDVKKVFFWLQTILNILLVLTAPLIALIFLFSRNRAKEIGAILLSSGILALVLLIVFAGFLWLGFGHLFDSMHKVLFVEGTWVFPEESILIQLYPQDFFVSIGFLIARNIFFIANIFIGAGIYSRYVFV